VYPKFILRTYPKINLRACGILGYALSARKAATGIICTAALQKDARKFKKCSRKEQSVLEIDKGEIDMTKRVLLSSIAVIAAGAAIFAVTALRKPVEAYAAEGAGKLTVTGQGSVSAKPDIAYVSVGATVQNASPTVAQSTNAEIMEKVLAAIKGLGIEEKDIQTSEYNIYPQVDYQNGNKVTGYTVTNVVRVAVRNLDITGEVLDQAVAAGANAGYGIQFSIQDSTPYYEQAMDLAIQGAISKARSVGKSLGVSVGSPVEIVESGGSYAPVNAGVMKALADESSARTSIQTGELTVTANITAVFNY
jgi:uncharacterized protein YggE